MIVNLDSAEGAERNTERFQSYLDAGGTIRLEKPGVYDLTGPLFIGNDTALEFGAGVFIRRMPPKERPCPLFVNRGLFDHEWNHNIRIEGLRLIVNQVDLDHYSIYPGLRGQLSFLGVRNLVIRDFQCEDLARLGYGIHICSFEDILLEQLLLTGDKDGVHLSDGRRFTIRDSRFGTSDDAIALNAYDYGLSTAIYGWIEDGLIENCHDLNRGNPVGYFCRMLGGTWTDWHEGMEVQNSTLAVYGGNLYSVCLPLPPEERETPLLSTVPPTHELGIVEWGGIPWRFVKRHDGRYDASCKRITFRDIYLHKPRYGFGFALDGGLWCNSVPKGLPLPVMEDLVFDGIHVECDIPFVFGGSHPVRHVRVSNSVLKGIIVDASVFQDHLANEYPVADYVFCGVAIPQPKERFGNIAAGRPVDLQFIGCTGGTRDLKS